MSRPHGGGFGCQSEELDVWTRNDITRTTIQADQTEVFGENTFPRKDIIRQRW